MIKNASFKKKEFIRLFIRQLVLSFLLLAPIFIIVGTDSAQALIPQFINYQSRLRDTGGSAVTSTTTIQFSIYNDEANGAPTDTASASGPLLWTEIYDQASGACQEITPDSDGYFALQLGTCASFPSYLDFTSDTLYVGVKISTDPEATPRARLGTAPYAFNSDLLDDIDSTSFLRSDQSDSYTSGTLTFDDAAILAFGTGTDLQITHDGTNTVFTSATGNVVIDNTNVTGSTQIQLGTDTNATDFQVLNDTGNTLFEVDGAGQATLAGDLLPSVDDTHSLGSSTLRWAELFVGPGTIHVGIDGNFGTFGYDTTNNYLLFDPDGNATHDIVFTDSGQIGVATTSPDARLDIEEAENIELIRFTDSTNSDSVGFFTGNATPEGTVSAQLGSLFLDSGNGALYVKNLNDGANTGWEELAVSSNASNAIYVGSTTATHAGTFTSGPLVSYEAANSLCASQFTGSHQCTTDEILNTIATQDTSSFTGNHWIAEGPPGFTASANDCDAWTTSSEDSLGPFWNWDHNTGGGRGFLTPCTSSIQIACCRIP